MNALDEPSGKQAYDRILTSPSYLGGVRVNSFGEFWVPLLYYVFPFITDPNEEWALDTIDLLGKVSFISILISCMYWLPQLENIPTEIANRFFLLTALYVSTGGFTNPDWTEVAATIGEFEIPSWGIVAMIVFPYAVILFFFPDYLA